MQLNTVQPPNTYSCGSFHMIEEREAVNVHLFPGNMAICQPFFGLIEHVD